MSGPSGATEIGIAIGVEGKLCMFGFGVRLCMDMESRKGSKAKPLVLSMKITDVR